MALQKWLAAVLCLAGTFTTAAVAAADEVPSWDAVEAVSIAQDAYIYGYPLVTFDTVRQQQTNVAAPDAEHAPMGQIIKMRTYPAVDNHCCAAPNADTLYTEVWLDVSKEPWVFSIPDMGDRYYIMPMLDGWSDVFAVASARTNGGGPQTYAITGPGWSGTLPEGVTQVESPTGMVWILGRIYSTGTPDDYRAVHALQDKFSVRPPQRLRQALHAAARRCRCRRRYNDGRAQAGQQFGYRGLFQRPREADEDQPADAAGRADGSSHGQDRIENRGPRAIRRRPPNILLGKVGRDGLSTGQNSQREA
jgi:hypothetical protein